jgi:hypothetical protein
VDEGGFCGSGLACCAGLSCNSGTCGVS